MSPVIPIVIGIEALLAAFATAELVMALAIVSAYMLAVTYGKMSLAEAQEVQKDIDTRIASFFGPEDLLDKLPVRNDVIVPVDGGGSEIIPLKVAPKRALTNSGGGVWMQDPLRLTDYGHTILHLYPILTRYPSFGDIDSVHGPEYNPFYPDGPPPASSDGGSGSGPPTPTFPELPYTGDITPYCRPWPEYGPFWDPNNGGAGGATPVPAYCVAVGGIETKRVDVLEGVAGRMILQPCISVYARRLPNIAEGRASSAISTQGSVINNTRFTLIMRKSGELYAGFAAHGYALANSPVCFPGQTIQIGGQSKGAGVEVAFRFEIWDIPYNPDFDSLSGNIKAAVDMIHKDERGLATFVMKPETANMVGQLYCFLDVPKVGSSKINCFEAPKEDIKDLSNIQAVSGDYNLESGSEHSFAGSLIKGTFTIGYGAKPSASFVLEGK